ncbi:hypothetical protein NQ317_007242 [Molorchus minor]|uniref:Uncharacterized protein n=1 Tax=Molorchus minor TaxID=1323400 RepID=A0ABQ9JVC0_9CUCU|nr:hypothetical protein NQ317_007242 [Molorchus minor]
MVEPIFDYQFRLILIGDSTVGKRFFLSDPTVGVDFFARLIEVKDGTRIKLQLWDTAGQERSVGALLVYDICNRASFEHIPLWMSEARDILNLIGLFLHSTEEVSREEAKAFSDQHGLFLVETSAKNGMNVEEAFRSVTRKCTIGFKQDGWDGIKTGFARPNGLEYNLVEA